MCPHAGNSVLLFAGYIIRSFICQSKDCLLFFSESPLLDLYIITSHNFPSFQVFMKESGWDIKVRNLVFHHLMEHIPPAHPITPAETIKEPMAFIRNAQVLVN